MILKEGSYVMLNGHVVRDDRSNPDLYIHHMLMVMYVPIDDVLEYMDHMDCGPLSDEEFWG